MAEIVQSPGKTAGAPKRRQKRHDLAVFPNKSLGLRSLRTGPRRHKAAVVDLGCDNESRRIRAVHERSDGVTGTLRKGCEVKQLLVRLLPKALASPFAPTNSPFPKVVILSEAKDLLFGALAHPFFYQNPSLLSPRLDQSRYSA